MRIVSKSFKACHDNNQQIALRTRQRVVDEHAHYFAPDISFDEAVNKTFVVRPPGDPLVCSVLALGDSVIIHDDLALCLNDTSLESGDRILIQNGRYDMGASFG